MLKRRGLLMLGGALVLPAGEAAAQENPHHHPGEQEWDGTMASATPFAARMPIPPVLAPTSPGRYRIDIQPARVEILPGLKTPVLSYGGALIGPTIRVKAGITAVVTYRNRLNVPANVHLHGGHVPPESDGHPMEVIEPFDSRPYHYPNLQRGATLWYHDHSHHTEAEHVYRGLHGFYLIEDEDESDLGLPAGSFDVPIMLRDALIAEDGQLIFNPADPLNRPTILANGRSQPYFPVARRKYRFRLLNASTHRIFQLNLDGKEFVQIASDGGLLPAPVPLTELRLTPAERVEIVIDFARFPIGSKVVLGDTSGPVLRFDVNFESPDRSRVPNVLRPLPALGVPTVTRELKLAFNPADITFRINDNIFDAGRVDAQIKHGTTEIWRIINTDTGFGGIPHNFHLHLVQFRVLDRDGVAPTPGEAGLKDTVMIPPGTSIRVQATFNGYVGRYVYHCHVLEHSQLGMMAQMEIAP